MSNLVNNGNKSLQSDHDTSMHSENDNQTVSNSNLDKNENDMHSSNLSLDATDKHNVEMNKTVSVSSMDPVSTTSGWQQTPPATELIEEHDPELIGIGIIVSDPFEPNLRSNQIMEALQVLQNANTNTNNSSKSGYQDLTSTTSSMDTQTTITSYHQYHAIHGSGFALAASRYSPYFHDSTLSMNMTPSISMQHETNSIFGTTVYNRENSVFADPRSLPMINDDVFTFDFNRY